MPDDPQKRLADERTPLIEPDEEAVRDAAHQEDIPAAPPPEKKRTWWQFAWNVIFAAFAIFVAVVFVKGFIDADDVEVCLALTQLCYFLRPFQRRRALTYGAWG